MTLNDDVLSAYFDGELPAVEMERVAEALKSDPAARARLEAFRRVQTLVGEADVRALEAAPAPLAAAVRAANVGGRERAGRFDGIRAAVESLFALPRPALAGFAMAVVAVAAVAFGMGQWVRAYSDGSALLAAANDLSAGSPLRTALERKGTGEGVDTAGGHITMVATFRDREGRYCREYDYGAAAPGSASVAGVACRAGGAWRVAIAVMTRSETVETGYAPASEDAHRAVEAFVREREMSAPISAEDEARAMARGWE